ncbi:MAG: hypothetical protein ABR497_02525 [Kiritimatiellia bacterium]|nr:hypothetical protein [Lentisphaerota bacterium]
MNLKHASSSVTFGVPFARHALETVALALLLDAGGNTVQRFFGLPNGRWTHLALTWRPSTTEGFDMDVQLFADGVEIKPAKPDPQGGPHYRVPGQWPGDYLQFSGGVWFSRLRISDVARYPGAKPPRENEFEPDAHTRLLCRFDGDGTLWSAGAVQPLKD